MCGKDQKVHWFDHWKPQSSRCVCKKLAMIKFNSPIARHGFNSFYANVWHETFLSCITRSRHLLQFSSTFLEVPMALLKLIRTFASAGQMVLAIKHELCYKNDSSKRSMRKIMQYPVFSELCQVSNSSMKLRMRELLFGNGTLLNRIARFWQLLCSEPMRVRSYFGLQPVRQIHLPKWSTIITQRILSPIKTWLLFVKRNVELGKWMQLPWKVI